MPDADREDTRHTRPHPPEMAGPFLEFDLTRELEQLRAEPQLTSGQNATTLVKFDDLRIVLMALQAHARVREHRTEGRVSVQTVHGHVRRRSSSASGLRCCSSASTSGCSSERSRAEVSAAGS
jgi:hypothetical protein